jgi:hypothetical protein
MLRQDFSNHQDTKAPRKTVTGSTTKGANGNAGKEEKRDSEIMAAWVSYSGVLRLTTIKLELTPPIPFLQVPWFSNP